MPGHTRLHATDKYITEFKVRLKTYLAIYFFNQNLAKTQIGGPSRSNHFSAWKCMLPTVTTQLGNNLPPRPPCLTIVPTLSRSRLHIYIDIYI